MSTVNQDQFAKQKLMGTAPVVKLILSFSTPAIIGMIVNALYNVVDKVYIGHLPGLTGENALAALTIVGPIMIVIFAFIMLFGVGGAAGISIYLGKKDYDKANKIAFNGVFSGFIVVTLIAALMYILKDKLLGLFGASPDTIGFAREYLCIILIGVPVNCLGFCLNRYIGAQGYPKISMVTMMIGAVVNIILDPIFIFVFDMGVAGAALATIIAQASSATWVIIFFAKGKGAVRIHPKPSELSFKVSLELMSYGMAAFAMQLGASLVQTFYNRSLLKYGGDIAVAAYGIVNSFSSILVMPIFGLNQGCQPLLGYNYGAKNYKRVRHILYTGMTFALIIVTIGFTAIMVFPDTIISIFASDKPELMSLSRRALQMCMAALLLIGPQIIGANYFQATGQPKLAMFLSLTRQIIFLIPIMLILPIFIKLDGVYLAGPLADTLAFVLTAAFVFREMLKLKKMESEDNVQLDSNSAEESKELETVHGS